MGSIAVFQVMIFLVIICVIAAPMAYFGVARENSGRRVTRGSYTLTFLGLFFAVMLTQIVADQMHFETIAQGASFIYLLIEFYLLRLTVRRLRDMGRGRNLAYLCLIPYLGILVHLWACFPRSSGASDTEIVKAF